MEAEALKRHQKCYSEHATSLEDICMSQDHHFDDLSDQFELLLIGRLGLGSR